MEVLRALATLLDPPIAAHAPIATALAIAPTASLAEHTDVLVFQAYPYASVYLGNEGMLGGDARDRIAGLLRALETEPPADVDHLGVLFAALAELADLEGIAGANAAPVRRARHALFWEHVASWMPPYLATIDRIASPFYARWAAIASAAVAAEADLLGPPARLATHLHLASPLPAELDRLDDLLTVVLAPVRVGFTLVRDDLLRAAGELGLGCRTGERRFALRSLLAQDAGAVLDWMADEAARQAAVYDLSPLEPTAAWWAARARAAAAWLSGHAEAGVRASVA
jgi:TorA maturation chaperone TorD